MNKLGETAVTQISDDFHNNGSYVQWRVYEKDMSRMEKTLDKHTDKLDELLKASDTTRGLAENVAETLTRTASEAALKLTEKAEEAAHELDDADRHHKYWYAMVYLSLMAAAGAPGWLALFLHR